MLEIIPHGDDTHRIHELRLARAPANALDTALLGRIRDAVIDAPKQGAQALIISGGPPFFSGGMDVPYLMSVDAQGLAAAWRTFFEAARALAKSPIPAVAAIGGHCPAGGCVLSLCCDYRVMAEGSYRIGLNEVQVGLVVPEAIQHLMRRVVGTYRAERLLVAGAMLDAQAARDIGLVDETTAADSVVPRALEWLQALLTLPRQPMLRTRAIARADLIAGLDDFCEADLDGFLAGWHSPDTQAAMRVLMAKLKK